MLNSITKMLRCKSVAKHLLILSLVALMPMVRATGGENNADARTTCACMADSLIKEGKKLLGTPYRFGSGGPNAFDCSGYTSYVYRKFGYSLDHSSSGQSRQGRKIDGPWSNLRKGDLVIFTARHNSERIGHVGIFIELDSTGKDFTFIHAAVQGGVIVSHISEPYYAARFVGARRILPDTDVQ